MVDGFVQWVLVDVVGVGQFWFGNFVVGCDFVLYDGVLDFVKNVFGEGFFFMFGVRQCNQFVYGFFIVLII